MVTEIEKAYLGGLVDGEGSVGLAKVTDEKYRLGFYLKPYVSFGMTQADEILKWIAEEYHGCTYLRKMKNPKHSQALNMNIQRAYVKQFLEDLLPYLKIKRRQACLVLDFFNNTPAWGSDQRLTNQVEIFNKLIQLNGKGRRAKPIVINTIRKRNKPSGKSPNWKPLFSKKELEDLYSHGKFSISTISNLMPCSSSTVFRYLRKFGIEMRDKKSAQLLRWRTKKQGLKNYSASSALAPSTTWAIPSTFGVM